MLRLTAAGKQIRQLAARDRPGALVLAEHAVDLHAELFSDPEDRLIALDALARDIIRIGRLHPECVPFLQRVDDYIVIVQNEVTAMTLAQAVMRR